MDISKIAATTAELAIIHPNTEEPIGIVFLLMPMSDPKIKAVIHTIRARMLRKRKQRFTPVEEDQNLIDIMVACVCGIKWKGDANWNGKKPKFTEELAREIIEPDSSDWIREQLTDHVGDTAHFFTK